MLRLSARMVGQALHVVEIRIVHGKTPLTRVTVRKINALFGRSGLLVINVAGRVTAWLEVVMIMMGAMIQMHAPFIMGISAIRTKTA